MGGKGPRPDARNLGGDGQLGGVEEVERLVAQAGHAAGDVGYGTARHQHVGAALDDGVAVVAAVVDGVLRAHHHPRQMLAG